MRRIALRPTGFILLGLALIIVLTATRTEATTVGRDMLLTDEQKELLIPGARQQYDKAVHFMDRGNYTVGFRYLKSAFDEQEDHADLNFLLGQLAVYRARQTFGKESMEYFDLAEKALRANLRIKNLSFTNRQRTEKKIEALREEREEVPARDNKRAEIGRQFIREQLIFRGADFSPKEEEKEKTTSGGAPVPAPPLTSAPMTSPFVAPSAPFVPAPAPAGMDSKGEGV